MLTPAVSKRSERQAVLGSPKTSVLKFAQSSRTNIYRRIAAGTFPAPVALGPRAVGWRKSDVIEWFDAILERAASMQILNEAADEIARLPPGEF
jgi:predicted DNA-binding transcriptional regulator AlpA